MVAPVRTAFAPKIISDLLKWEVDPTYSREQGTLKALNVVKIGTPLGRIELGAASSAAKSGGNTANSGTFVLDATTPVLAGAESGVYTLRCITAATNGGVFRLEDPRGRVLGDFAITGGAGGTVTVNDKIKGVLTDGTADFVVGDGFDITVAAGSGKLVVLAPAALDGSAKCIGFSLQERDPGNADGVILYLARMAVIADSGIAWPDAFTSDQKLAAVADALAAPCGIVTRVGI